MYSVYNGCHHSETHAVAVAGAVGGAAAAGRGLGSGRGDGAHGHGEDNGDNGLADAEDGHFGLVVEASWFDRMQIEWTEACLYEDAEYACAYIPTDWKKWSGYSSLTSTPPVNSLREACTLAVKPWVGYQWLVRQ